jgi:inorganic pyrophosphatase
MRYLDIPIGDRAPEVFNVVVEIPKGSENKYEYDAQLDVFRLDRTLYSPIHYPGDYGLVPSTKAADGDPLDALVLVTDPTFTGCVVQTRAVGLVKMVDQGIEDLKLVCVPTRDPHAETILRYTDIDAHALREIEYLLRVYKALERKETETHGWADEHEAKEVLLVGAEIFKRNSPPTE